MGVGARVVGEDVGRWDGGSVGGNVGGSVVGWGAKAIGKLEVHGQMMQVESA